MTAIRTGAAGGLAAELLSKKSASTVTIFGAGVQGRSQLAAVMCVRRIKKIIIVDPVKQSARQLAEDLTNQTSGVEIELCEDTRNALERTDIVITATTSDRPVFNGNDLQAGVHVTGVGSFTPDMQEVDEIAVKRARVFVDSREACLAEAGDIIQSKATIEAEIGEVVNGTMDGRKTDDEITFFKSVGLAAQDAAAAAAVIDDAVKNNLGTVVTLSN